MPVSLRATTHDQRLEALVESERRIAAEQAYQFRLLAVMEADPPDSVVPGEPDKQWLREEVACVLRLSPMTAAARLDQALTLARVPRVLDQLAAGAITVHHARAFADGIATLDDAVAGRVADRVLERAEEQSVGEFRRSLAKALLLVAPVEQETAREQNLAARRIRTYQAGPGVSELWALLPDESVATVMTAIGALARRCGPGDERTRDQREVDALTRICADSLAGESNGPLLTRPRLRPAIQVTVALSTLLGCDEQPGELAGVGPIPATLARQLAADPTGTWRRLVTDECGRLLDYGRTTYRPPTDLSDKVVARDRTCRFPHCSRPARQSQLDHRIAWADGGPTSETNMYALCSRHHHLKHETRWRYQPTDDGSIDWTSPAGHTYQAPPGTYPIDQTMTGTGEESAEIDPDPPPF